MRDRRPRDDRAAMKMCGDAVQSSSSGDTRRDGVEPIGKSLPQLVVAAARAIYGDRWRLPLAQSLGLNQRTVRKIGSAAALGTRYPVSPGILLELAALARSTAAACDRATPDGCDRAVICERVAVELARAANVWAPVRRPVKAGQGH
jgi:hypothetical protein